jgi:hypothetical protein
MPNTFKTLYRGAAATSSATLYTVPAATSTLISTILVTNTSASAQTFTITLDGVSIATTVSVPANDTNILEIKQHLGTTKIIAGLASATTVNFHITGIEIT